MFMDSNLDKYLAFIKTAEYGSISKSAESLNYSQSAVSKMIIGKRPGYFSF